MAEAPHSITASPPTPFLQLLASSPSRSACSCAVRRSCSSADSCPACGGDGTRNSASQKGERALKSHRCQPIKHLGCLCRKQLLALLRFLRTVQPRSNTGGGERLRKKGTGTTGKICDCNVEELSSRV